ncbi:tetratricopeptide repeat protein [Phaeacidiphilus oryzae]|uniref:tetratricopeptide repeat protein n=1 Tax=Phaeacidiphilus oryzae TaxID=348818 RepID=UPI00068FC4CC|nr:tetratricopeptide repeat protein [Phaeacidiphilus oryzae]
MSLEPEEFRRLRHAELLLDTERTTEAIERLGPLAATRPDEAWVQAVWARALVAAERYEEALSAARRALAVDSGHQVAWLMAARALRRLTRHDEAVRHCADAIRALPDRAPVHREYAISLLDGPGGGLPEEAYRAASEAIRLDPQQAAGHYLLGLAAQRLHPGFRWGPVAVAAFEEALRLDPEFTPARNTLAVIQLGSGRVGEAARGFAASAAADPQQGIYQHNVQVVALRLVSRLRWIALAALVVCGGVGSAMFPEPLGHRLTANAVLTSALLLAWALWWAGTLRPLPKPVRATVFRLVRTRGSVRLGAIGVGVGSACGLIAAAVPLPDPGWYGLLWFVGLVTQAVLILVAGQVSRARLAELRRTGEAVSRRDFRPAGPPGPRPPFAPESPPGATPPGRSEG